MKHTINKNSLFIPTFPAIDKQQVARRFARAVTTYSEEATIQRQIAEKMLHLLQEYTAPPYSEIYEFGCGTGIYSRLLLKHLQPKKLWLNDLCPEMETCYNDLLSCDKVHFIAGDAETLPIPGSPSIITSCSTLQWFVSPEHFFQKCAANLCAGGIFAFSTFGERNMEELRTLTGNGLHYRTRYELEDTLYSHFQLLHSEEEILTLSFTNPTDVLRHLRRTGVNGAISGNRLWTKNNLTDFCKQYEQRYGSGSSVSLTYHPIYIIAKLKMKIKKKKIMNNVYFVSGIDTDAGKSYATGFLAREWNAKGIHTITQKLIQTGNVGHSEDIDLHRRIMGIKPTPDDHEGLTMPEIFSYPASPHLAAKIDKREIDFHKIKQATETLSKRYDAVLLEGAGGLMVPLTTELLTIDYIAREGYPLIFVTSGKLGSINHTLLSLEAIQKRGITLHSVLYNLYPTVEDKTIQNDTMEFIQNHLSKYFPTTAFQIVPEIKLTV